MGTLRFVGKQRKVAQVNNITPASVGIGNTFSVVINGKTVTFTATATTVANVTAGLKALLSAATEPEFTEITWADATTHITGTAGTPGKPFTQTSSAAGGTATLVTSTSTANKSPEDWNDAVNYSTAALPVDADDLVLDAGANNGALWNAGSLSGVALTSLTVLNGFELDGGLSDLDDDGEQYSQYRPTYLAIGVTTVTIGDTTGLGVGSGLFKLNTGTGQTLVNVFVTGQPRESLTPAFVWKGTHAANVFNLNAGSVGVALLGGEVATIATLRISDGTMVCGAGVTLGTITQTGGALDTVSAITAKVQNSGVHTHREGAITTLTVRGGAIAYLSAGTITTLTLYGAFDAGNDSRAMTITNCTMYPGAVLSDQFGRITFSNPISTPGGIDSVTIRRGGSTNVQFS